MQPKWKQAERFERVRTFDLNAKMKDVFPLLCPVREYEWLPGWSCTMLYSESGVAEKNATFLTHEMFGRRVMWTTITREPDHSIEYLLVMGQDAVVRLSIALEEKGPDETRVVWKMLFTAISPLAKRALPRAYSEEKFREMLEKRESELNHFLATGTMMQATQGAAEKSHRRARHR